MSGIKKRDRNLEWLSAYRDLENPGRLKAKQSSNRVFLGSAVVIGGAAIAYTLLFNQNAVLEREIDEHLAYIEDPRNIDIQNWHILLQSRSVSLINYRDGAEKFLEQLKNAERVSEEGFRYYETALKEVTSEDAYITQFTWEHDSIQMAGVVANQDMPRIFAEYLTNLEDEEGNLKFYAVDYTGFAEIADGYEFTLKITLQEKLE